MPLEKLPDPKVTAKRLGLFHISDDAPGIGRRGKPGRFFYVYASGRRVRDAAVLRRIARLAIPPAWTDVWIAPFADAHLVATGRDAKGRKQYRYHSRFAASRDEAKFEHLHAFAESLPLLHRRLNADLQRSGVPREKILAAIVTLLEETLIRVGNEDYARANGSYGLTTLRNRHVKVEGSQLRFLFRGKSGRQWSLALRDRRVARVIRSCQDLPGQHLFEYCDDAGKVHAVNSSDVNAYLREITGRDITAKDFRTWAGTVEAARAFAGCKTRPGPAMVKAIIAQVAERLGNTIAICRKCYIHPAVIEGFQDGSFEVKNVKTIEREVLAYLRRNGRQAEGAIKR